MAANIWKTGTSNAVTTTLNGSISLSDTTISLTSVTGLQSPGVMVVDRVDANDAATPTVREYISYTGISGSDLTGCSRAGLGGSSAQAHASGATVEEVWSITHWNDFIDTFDVEHEDDGSHDDTIIVTLIGTQTLTNKTLTSPVINTPTGDVVTKTGTQTLTNKRTTRRITTIATSATPTIDTDDCDAVTITALGTAISSMTTNLSGTPTNFQTLIVRILDNGTARAITWGAKFEARGINLPTTTTISKLLTVGFIYDTVDAIWGCVASVNEA